MREAAFCYPDGKYKRCQLHQVQRLTSKRSTMWNTDTVVAETASSTLSCHHCSLPSTCLTVILLAICFSLEDGPGQIARSRRREKSRRSSIQELVSSAISVWTHQSSNTITPQQCSYPKRILLTKEHHGTLNQVACCWENEKGISRIWLRDRSSPSIAERIPRLAEDILPLFSILRLSLVHLGILLQTPRRTAQSVSISAADSPVTGILAVNAASHLLGLAEVPSKLQQLLFLVVTDS